MDADVLIVGAGASGLMAGRKLVNSGFRVLILEARSRPGGRIYTSSHAASGPLEFGAEFIHGTAPLTRGLAREAAITVKPSGGRFYSIRLHPRKEFPEEREYRAAFDKKLLELASDMPLELFLEKFFPGDEFLFLREDIRGFAEGFDAADPGRLSTFAFRDEWTGNELSEQGRVEGGFGKLMDFLVREIEGKGSGIVYATPVRQVRHGKDKVEVVSADGTAYTALKIIISVPPPVLFRANDISGIRFLPEIPRISEIARQIGYGDVIKILLLFREPFWKSVNRKFPDIGFLLNDSEIPAWWTQYPDNSSLLTGWIAGSRAGKWKNQPDVFFRDLAFGCLERIFRKNAGTLSSLCTGSHIINWSADPFACGAYSYKTTDWQYLASSLAEPVDHQIYFTGEATFLGREMGTVEAALASGQQCGEKVLAEWKS